MRWEKTKIGSKRIKTAFLLFPKQLRNSDGNLETRWLEVASWVQTFEWTFGGESWANWRGEWIDDGVKRNLGTVPFTPPTRSGGLME